MTPLISSACQTLHSNTSSTAMRRVAATTLLACVDQGVELPPEVPKLLWSHLRAHDRDGLRNLSGLGAILGPELVPDVVNALGDPEAGEGLRDGAAYILCSSQAAQHVTDQQIMTLVEGATREDQVGRVARLISSRHEARVLDSSLLIAIRDRWRRHEDAGVRRVALDVNRELPGRDIDFVATMVSDHAVEVRKAASDALDSNRTVEGRAKALTILRAAIAEEKHPEVLGHLYWSVELLEAD